MSGQARIRQRAGPASTGHTRGAAFACDRNPGPPAWSIPKLRPFTPHSRLVTPTAERHAFALIRMPLP